MWVRIIYVILFVHSEINLLVFSEIFILLLSKSKLFSSFVYKQPVFLETRNQVKQKKVEDWL